MCNVAAVDGPAAELPRRLQRATHRQPARRGQHHPADGALPPRGHGQ